MFCCLRVGYSVLRRILSLWYTKEPVVRQRVDENITTIESVSLDRAVTKYIIWDKDHEARTMNVAEAEYILNENVKLPWLWIGANSESGSTDMTNSFKPYLVSGNIITPEFLKNRYPSYYDWKYLDPVTFKEVEFPDGGITIDASRVERAKEEIEEDKCTR
jgi:hypothetical protein